MLAAVAVAVAAPYWLQSSWLAGASRINRPTFQQLTFRRGRVLRTRYTPDGASIIYGATWEGAPWEIFTSRLDGTESRPFGVKNADVLAVSSKGELAVLLKKTFAGERHPRHHASCGRGHAGTPRKRRRGGLEP